MDNVAPMRKEDLLRAAEWARLHQAVEDFIGKCESRWKAAAPELTAQQQDWLQWARTTAERWSPFARGYPDPNLDGPFDRNTVPFGGPYPLQHKMPVPPTMPVIPPPQPARS